MTSFLKIIFLALVVFSVSKTVVWAKSLNNANKNSQQTDETTTHIPLPKDLTDNSDPFNSTQSKSGADTEQYFHQQQNFLEQNPTRSQESDRIIRQFE